MVELNLYSGKIVTTEAEYSTALAVLDGEYYRDCIMSSFHDGDSEISDTVSNPSSGKPPRSESVMRHCRTSSTIFAAVDTELCGGGIRSPVDSYVPVFRSGSCAERGPKRYMEDEHVRIDNLVEHVGASVEFSFPYDGAFYGVFDGHGGTDAVSYVSKNIMRFIIEDAHFPSSVGEAIKSAFLKADRAFAGSATLDISSGTTALAALIFGRTMVVANAGDCRAVLGKRGRAVELSNDHKPDCAMERLRIEKHGGVIYDGYLNGQLSVARALGDWHMKDQKGQCALSGEPEMREMVLSEDDEFLILGCDGLWDVMSSQCAVTMVRKDLVLHNDPWRCSKELVREALKRNTCDNLTVIVVCFSSAPPPHIHIPPLQSRVRRSISVDGLNFLRGVLNTAARPIDDAAAFLF